MKEEITVREDGTGKYTLYSDLIPGMRDMMTKMGAAFREEGKESDPDSLAAAIEEKLWKDFGNEPIDSVMDFTSDMPDSLKNDPKVKELARRVTMFMEGGREKGYLNAGMRFEFDDDNDLTRVLKLFSEQQSQEQGAAGGFQAAKIETTYLMKGKKFSRRTKLLEEAPKGTESMLKMMFNDDAKYEVHLTMPNEIAKVQSEHLKSIEGKTAILEYDLMDIVTGKELGDYTVIMKKK
ncbi:MAG: hypothetical protein AAF740_06940 [Bacteroidota bacterium]